MYIGKLEKFSEWLEGKRSDRTVSTYYNQLKGSIVLNNIDIVTQSKYQIAGAINKEIASSPSKLLIASWRKYLKYLFETESKKLSPIDTEKLNEKILDITRILRLPEMKKFETMDIENKYIPADVTLTLLKNCAQLEKSEAVMMKSIIILLYDTGARIEEVLDNWWANCTNNMLKIPSEISKSPKGRNVVFEIPETAVIMEKWKEHLSKIQKLENTTPLYPNMSHIMIYKRLKKLGQIVGFRLKDYVNKRRSAISPHWFRHTRITDLASEGWELGKLQRRAGHTDPKITNHYINYINTHTGEVKSLEKYCKEKNIKLKDYM